jgi:hypothetical protein
MVAKISWSQNFREIRGNHRLSLGGGFFFLTFYRLQLSRSIAARGQWSWTTLRWMSRSALTAREARAHQPYGAIIVRGNS